MSEHRKELWIAFIHSYEVAVISHHFDNIFVFFPVALIDRLDCYLGKAKQLSELVFIVLIILCFIQTHLRGETIIDCISLR